MENVQNNGQVTMLQLPNIKFNWIWALVGLLALLFLFVGGGYNGLIQARENVRGAASKVQTAYQNRQDLVSQLVSTVKGSANFEQQTLNQVIEARAKATSVTLNANNIEEYQKAQDGLSSSLSRLLAVAEAYPNLQTTQSFRDLQVQLEGIENRIKTARNDYNDTVRAYNGKIQTFPTNLTAKVFGFKSESYFTADTGAGKAPNIDFGTFQSGASSPAVNPIAE